MLNNITQIPAPRVPIIDEKTGLMSREWYRFFINIFALTGDGSNNISLEDLQLTPREEIGTLAAKNSVSLTSDVTGVLPTASGGTGGLLPTPNGGTGLSSFTANGVVYASSASALATGSTLVFNGNALGLNGAPAASAILDGQSTTQGVRFPNMTTAQKNAISSPAAGLVIFDTTLSKLCVYTGAAWQTVTSV
ncbi:hypothetical protein UFOVP764_11 [uncultured Caudovirales phage]|uniref:Uncharacterized protein n=1 Tax=uncultured Caudovirales phage TaxID=2100421 RepID=A0A6J5NMQ8_9CAUD|nr:hypothetical protein UFOVP764_11 [uncultured Caudovirales phage]